MENTYFHQNRKRVHQAFFTEQFLIPLIDNTEPIIIKEDKGIMIISFWATWCKPCIQELDYLNDFYDELNGEKEVTVYAISIDDARSVKRVLPFVNGKNWEFEILLDKNSDLKRKMNVLNVPHTFIIDKNRKIVYQHTSYIPGDEEEYWKIIESLN